METETCMTPLRRLPSSAPGGLNHVAILMDGNGRWAERRGRHRLCGHHAGATRIREIVEACIGAGIRHLTLFAFSTENWRRPATEVDGLMTLFKEYIRNEAAVYDALGVRVQFIGDRAPLDGTLCSLMAEFETRTRSNDKLTLTLAVNYGARDEITRAMRELARSIAQGDIDPGDIDQSTIAAHLDSALLPDPDLIIRTSGEMRTSNFLLWQAAYAEYAFTDTLWPDFSEAEFLRLCARYHGRTRRFGGV